MTNIDTDFLHLFSDKEIAKIYALSNENELQESEFLERCHDWSHIEDSNLNSIPTVASAEIRESEWMSASSPEMSDDFD